MLDQIFYNLIYFVCATKYVWVTAVVLAVASFFMAFMRIAMKRITKRDYLMLDKITDSTMLMSIGIFGLYLLFWLNVLLYPMSPDSTVPWICVGISCAILAFICYIAAVIIKVFYPEKTEMKMPVMVLMFLSLLGSSTLIPTLLYL